VGGAHHGHLISTGGGAPPPGVEGGLGGPGSPQQPIDSSTNPLLALLVLIDH